LGDALAAQPLNADDGRRGWIRSIPGDDDLQVHDLTDSHVRPGAEIGRGDDACDRVAPHRAGVRPEQHPVPGRQDLHGWLLTQPELPEYRNNFLIQLAWMDELSGDELDASLARYAEEISIQIKMRQAKLDRPAVAPNRTPREKFLWKRIEENLVSIYQRELEWVNILRQDLREQYHNRTE